MRASLVVILFLLPLVGFGQSKETFLLYEATDFLRRSKNDTTFRLDAFVVLDAKKLTIRSFPRYADETSKRHTKYTRVSDQIILFDEGKVVKILRSSIFKGGNKTTHLLVPINKMGLKVAPFEGQLIEHFPSGRKMKFIRDSVYAKYFQNTYYFINFDQPSTAEFWKQMIYLDDKYFNLMSLPGILGWFQLSKIITDSAWYVCTYPSIAHKGDSTTWHSTFTKKSLLSKSALKRITENLQGKWIQTSGFKLNGKLAPDSSRAIQFLDSLRDCKYTFTFDKDKLILERNSFYPEMKTIDTLSYSINSTGDWIWMKGNSDVDIILDKLDSKSAKFSVKESYKTNSKTCTGYLVLYLRREE
jgi:hypothetical protein